MTRLFRLTAATSVCILVLQTVGCVGLGSGTPQITRYYVLHSQSKSQTISCVSDHPTIGIGPVEFPRYLSRQEIVTRINENELQLANFSRWAEPLEDNFSGVLEENLSSLLHTDKTYVFPWKNTDVLDYRIGVEVIQFDGQLENDVTLKCVWSLYRKGEKSIPMKIRSTIVQPVAQKDFQSLVSAMSLTVEVLAREIAAAVRADFQN